MVVITLYWPSTALKICLFKPTSRNDVGFSFILLDYPNGSFCTHTHTHKYSRPDVIILLFFYCCCCCCWRNPLAILVIINYSKWINLTRYRTTKVIFESVAEIYLPIKLTLKNIYLVSKNDDGCVHWNYAQSIRENSFFLLSLCNQRQWRWWRRQWWRKMKLVCVRVSMPTLD